MQKTTHYAIRLLLPIFLLVLVQSCKKSRSDVGQAVFKETRNKVFKQVEADAFYEVFKSTLEKRTTTLKNPKWITAFYAANDYEPVLLMQQLPGKKLQTAADRLSNASQHGLDPELFRTAALKALIAKVYDDKAIQTVEQAYTALAELEITAADAFTNYSNVIQYGLVNPRKIYRHYYTEIKRPDSAALTAVLTSKDLKKYLDSIQPTHKDYLAIQKALQENVQVPGMNKEESARIMIVNLERLRWTSVPAEKKYVWVNIPDFTLDVIENGSSTLHMKVCVGEGRNQDYKDKLTEYDENDLMKDRPFNRETPQLKSLIHSVQVNPVWNIPQSIATNEITKDAAKDRYYLANNNIDVFKNGVRIEDPETIDFSAADAGKTYQFKQRPGADNALGKIKFLFDNQSSVYLHDTPAQQAFKQNMRAVSHGCVRVEKPQELARALFGEGDKLGKIKAGMASKNPKATDIMLTDKVPVYLAYFTCWQDKNKVLQFRKDVYGLDIVLYTHMMKIS